MNCARHATFLTSEGANMSSDPNAVYDPTPVDVSLLVLRVGVGAIFAAHGAQKLLGAFTGFTER